MPVVVDQCRALQPDEALVGDALHAQQARQADAPLQVDGAGCRVVLCEGPAQFVGSADDDGVLSLSAVGGPTCGSPSDGLCRQADGGHEGQHEHDASEFHLLSYYYV